MTGSPAAPLRLFEATGVELEYMIVDARTLDVRPVADELLRDDEGAVVGELEHGPIAWCNELVLHVLELKTNGPASRLEGLDESFQHSLRRANDFLAPRGARLMPTAMHPWMDPARETVLWPHEDHTIYETFDRIFDCCGHGWSNLQSLHINLPFGDDDEFGRLHAAVRLLLPILPGIAASSPVRDGQVTGTLDNRLAAYRTNCARIPSVSGLVVPEAVFSRSEYSREVFERMRRDIAPYDPGGVLQLEFLNARGAIARFSRGSIEIRVLDVQECPRADLAIVALCSAVLRLLTEGHFAPQSAQRAWEARPLAEILAACTRDADGAVIDDPLYGELFGLRRAPIRAGELWSHVLEEALGAVPQTLRPWERTLRFLLERGALARRILEALDGTRSGGVDHDALAAVYSELCDCLAEGRLLGE